MVWFIIVKMKERLKIVSVKDDLIVDIEKRIKELNGIM